MIFAIELENIKHFKMEDKISKSRGGKKQWHRIFRKIKLVLVIRHCIADLKASGGLDYLHETGNGTGTRTGDM
jgi:hypothetical protein